MIQIYSKDVMSFGICFARYQFGLAFIVAIFVANASLKLCLSIKQLTKDISLSGQLELALTMGLIMQNIKVGYFFEIITIIFIFA